MIALHNYGYVNVCMVFDRREVPYDSVSLFSNLQMVLTLYNMLVIEYFAIEASNVVYAHKQIDQLQNNNGI